MKRGLRTVGWGLLGLLGLAILVVLATNVLLRTRLLRKLVNAKPDALTVEYHGAACWLPGRLSFDTVTLRSRDRNIELEAALQGVTLQVSLADLTGRRFHVKRLRARGLRFRLRELLARAEATPARLARYPRIQGFADPPLLPTASDPPTPARRPWRVVIDDLAVAGVGEIWIDAWRWTGTGTVEGSFELLPGREARVGPARLEVAGGELRHGDSTVAERTLGAVWCELPRFRKQAYPGDEVWKIMTGGSKMRAELASLAFLSTDSVGPRVTGGAGSIHELIQLRDGVGSVKVDVTARGVAVRQGDRAFSGTARVDLHAPEVDFRRGEASLAGTRIVLSEVSVSGGPAPPWGATFSTPAARLSFADGSFDGRIVGRLRDARPVVALLPSGLPKWIATLLDLQDLEVTGRLTVGPARFGLTALRLSAGSFSLAGDYESSPGRRHGRFRARKGRLSVRISVPGGG